MPGVCDVDCVVQTGGRYYVRVSDVDGHSKVVKVRIEGLPGYAELDINEKMKDCDDVIEFDGQTMLVFVADKPPQIYSKGKLVHLRLNKGLYQYGWSSKLPVSVIGGNLWYPVKVKRYMNSPVASYARLPLEVLKQWIELAASSTEKSKTEVFITDYVIRDLWKLKDACFYKHRCLYSVHEDYTIRLFSLKDSKVIFYTGEGSNSGRIVAIDQHIAVCSNVEELSGDIYAVSYYAIVDMRNCYCATITRSNRGSQVDLEDWHALTTIKTGSSRMVFSYMSFGKVALLVVCRQSINVIADVDISSRLPSASKDISGLHYEGKGILRAFTKNGEHFTITIKL